MASITLMGHKFYPSYQPNKELHSNIRKRRMRAKTTAVRAFPGDANESATAHNGTSVATH